jgi:hypothetical protein
MQFKRILDPVDWDFCVNAWEYALTAAETYKAHWVAVHAVELSKYPYADYVRATGGFAHLSRALCQGGKAKLQEFMCGAELTLFHGVEGAPDLTAAEVIIAARTERLDTLISDDQHKHLNIRTAARCSKPYGEIAGYAEEVQAHHTVMAAAMLWTAPFSARRRRVVQLGPVPAIHT